jgi:hypothetical protein
MKAIPPLIVILCLGLLIGAPTRLHAQALGPGLGDSALAKNLVGTWVLVSEGGKAGNGTGRLKFCTGRHWVITQSDPRTGSIVYHHGGTYTLRGNEYAETVEYANDNTKQLLKQTFRFSIKIDGDTLTQTGIGNSFNEVWKRVK